MLQWLRSFFSAPAKQLPSDERQVTSENGERAQEDQQDWPRLDQVYIEPDSHADFDPAACQRLIKKLSSLGANTVLDASGLAVSLEDFFEGNRCKHSIAGNVEPLPPYDTAAAWYELLKRVRATIGVENIWVEITDLEVYEDRRVGTWPYSDTIWIYSTLDQDQIAALVAPLEPGIVQDASLNDPNFDLQPPFPPTLGVRPYWVWWD